MANRPAWHFLLLWILFSVLASSLLNVECTSTSPEPESESESEAESEAESTPEPREAGPILAPPFTFIALIIFALAGLFFKSQIWKGGELNLERSEIVNYEKHPAIEPFLSPFDDEVQKCLRKYPNHPFELAKVSGPCIVSLAFCPFTLYSHGFLLESFWQSLGVNVETLNINDAIQCFLTPSGLVYAIMFGFVFQFVAAKQQEVQKRLMFQVGLMGELVTMTTKLHFLPEDRMEVLRSVKDECISMMSHILNRSQDSFKNDPPGKMEESLYSVLDKLRRVDVTDKSSKVDAVLMNKAITNITEIIGVDSDQLTLFHARLHVLQWMILESLGFLAFLGILLVDGKSHRFELLICMITVFSISMLCYIVSDMDFPFSGFFRIDLQPLYDVITSAEEAYFEAYTHIGVTAEWQLSTGKEAGELDEDDTVLVV
ncbi:uncharacterized protein LOC106167610 [Lingula anatina]|uniref:Uncharacterized protein LOC106167610 n=1 Tax=Lingula anatina TaxID=7574 RepID=A0A1S3IVP2_LINAN|nr:uncharacterized protein LOC106167610 [Lingula anatina]|eukprot:XP_013402262.1 uncharacterized protein LOC106167610 [Lingula anatina]